MASGRTGNPGGKRRGREAEKTADNGGVYIVPAFTELGAPYWDMHARGTIVGITRGTNRQHIIRAAEEAIAYQSADLVEAMEKDTGIPVSELRVDGGASRDAFLLQFQSDILNRQVIRAKNKEITALGAACLAGLSCGLFQNEEEVHSLWRSDRVFEPQMEASHRRQFLQSWHRAAERSLGWEQGQQAILHKN